MIKTCGAEDFKFYEVALVVTEGGIATTKDAQWRAMIELKSSRGKLRTTSSMHQFKRGMWEHFRIKKRLARTVLEDADKASLSGADDKWQLEAPHKEEPELLTHSTDLRFDGLLMGQSYHAEKSADWAKFLNNDELNAWSSGLQS